MRVVDSSGTEVFWLQLVGKDVGRSHQGFWSVVMVLRVCGSYEVENRAGSGILPEK